MDIALDPDGGVVIQYVNTEEFEELIAPLNTEQNPDEIRKQPAKEPVANPGSS
jgi:hypothetical protein